MAADPIDIAATVGTWVAVLLALIALIGIIAPYLVLKATHSDRYQALAEVDSGKTAYVEDRWRLTRSIRFRAVRVPIFTAPPSQRGGPRLRLSILERVGEEVKVKVLPVSRTGWVNIAHLVHHYAEDVKLGDILIIRQREAWFPMHRFFILGVGLRGRYGHRVDHGEQTTVQTTARLVTEEPVQTDEGLWRQSTTAGKLYGTTGTIWWRRSLNSNETRFDGTYFAPHPDSLSNVDVADPTPIDELFWLAIGCLPARNRAGIIKWVYDLTYESRRPIQSTRGALNRGALNRGGNQPAAVQIVQFQPRSSLNARHYEWATAMGASSILPENVFYLDMSPQADGHGQEPTRVSASHMERMACGVLKLHLSGHGFLLPESKPIATFFSHMRPKLLREVSEGSRSPIWELFNVGCNGWAREALPGDTLKHLRDNISSRQNDPFSRKRASLCKQLDSEIMENLGTMGDGLWALAVLSLTNAQFFATIVRELIPMNNHETIDITVTGGNVSIRGIPYDLEHEALEIGQVGGPGAANQAPQPVLQEVEMLDLHRNTRNRVFLTLLWACVRIAAVDTNLDSKPLLQMVTRMANIVHVSSSASAPIIHSSVQAQGGGNDGNDGRLRGRRRGAENRGTAGGGVASGASSETADTDNPYVFSPTPSERGEEGRENGAHLPREE